MRHALTILLLACAIDVQAQSPVDQRRDPERPLQRLTPGRRLTTRVAMFCQRGYATRVRSVSASRRHAVYHRYGFKSRPPGYVIDHLIPLQLGGSNAITNLFPMPRAASFAKDSVEDWAHARACSIRTPTETRRLQHGFRRNWRALYAEMLASTP